MFRTGYLIAASVVLLAACSSPEPATPDAPEAPTASEPTPPPEPVHLWIDREGRDYGYAIANNKKEDIDAGTPARVAMFRYLGEKDGIYTIVDADTGARYTCNYLCKSAKQMFSNGETERFVLEPTSAIGKVFTDALNGQLEIYEPEKQRKP